MLIPNHLRVGTNPLVHVVLFTVLLLIAGCKGSNDVSVPVSTGSSTSARSATPQMVKLVEVSSIEVGTLSTSWLPAQDDQTPHDKLVYGVYVSTQKGFIPSFSTLKTTVTGGVSAQVNSLQAGETYYVMITATDQDGNISWSNALESKTVAIAAKRTGAVVHSVSANQAQQAARGGSVAFKPAEESFKAGEFLVSGEGGGYLRKVTNTTAAKGGASTAQTEAASLNEVFSELAFATTVKFEDVPAQPVTASKMAARPASSSQEASVEWQDTGLTLSSSEPVEAPKLNGKVMAQRATVSGNKQTDVGLYTVMTAPAYAYAQPNQPFTLEVPIEVVNNKDGGTFTSAKTINLCKIELANFSHPSNLRDALSKPTATPTVSAKNGKLTLNWTPTTQHVDPDGAPYVATVTAYLDDSTCDGGNVFGAWEDTVTLKIPVYVTQGEPDDQQTDKPITFEGDFKVVDNVSYSIKPEMQIAAEISGASLKSADLKVSTDLSFTNRLTITADAAAHLDKTVQVLDQKRFTKVFMAGSVPVVVSGKFRIKAHLEGNVTGAAKLEKLLELKFPETMFGLEYRDGAWQVVKNFQPSYTFSVTGEADAHADLTLTLIPDLEVSFYDMASGRMLVEPYLYAEADVHGQFKYLDDNGNVLIDPPDYWFNKLEAGGGANMRLYAGLHVFDYNIATYPENVTLDEIDKFKQVTVFNKTPFYALPEMKASLRADVPDTGLTDSRVLFVKGEAKNYSVTVLGHKFGLNTFNQWTAPKLITDQTGAALQAVALADPSVEDVSDVNYRFNYTMPGTYEVRLGGYSSLGSYVRQIAPLTVVLTDDDNDGMIDQWEQRYGVSAAGADDDGDGVTNLNEFKAGTFPNQPLPDADGDGIPYEWEVSHGLNPNDPSDALKDNDGDGISNLDEYKKGTDPNDNLTTDSGSHIDVTKCSTNFSTTFKPHEITNLDGSKTTVSTFTPSGSLSGNVLLEGGTLDLQGQMLTINGDLIQSGGALNVNNGTLVVTGNYRIQKPDDNGGCIASGGILHMLNAAGKVQVNGSFVMDSQYLHRYHNSLTAGTLEIKGDFTQQSSGGNEGDPAYNFEAQGSHKVVLSGVGKQSVSFKNNGSSRFANLDIQNTKPYAVNFATGVPAINNLSYTSDTLYLQDAVFQYDLTLPKNLYLTVSTGNVTQFKGGTLNLNGKSMIVNSNFIHSGGWMDVNGGKLLVSGDYRIQTPAGDGKYTYSIGVLKMVKESDVVQVGGSFVMDRQYSHMANAFDVLTAGTLEIKGDFTQQSSGGNEGYQAYNFHAQDSHKVVLSGAGKQTVSFKDGASANSRLSNLQIDNLSTDGVVFTTRVRATGTLSASKGVPKISGNLPGAAILGNDIEVIGKTLHMADDVNLAGKTLKVNGDIIQSGGWMDVNGGKLLVSGDYRIQIPASDGKYTYSIGVLNMVKESDVVQVGGSFVMDSQYSHSYLLTAGTLEVKGDFTQQSSAGNEDYQDHNFEAQGSHKVVLSGAGKQTVSFKNNNSSRFANLDIQNTKPYAVNFATGVPVINNLSYTSDTLYLQDAVFQYDLTLPKNLYLTASTGNVTQLTGGVLNLNGKSMIVNGDIVHSGGWMDVNEGKLLVSGDYRIQTPDSKGGYTYSNGILQMVNEADKVQVNGNFVMESQYAHGAASRNVLTAGTLEVKGDLTQQSSGSSGEGYQTYNFYTQGSHKVVLSGTSKQTVKFQDNGASSFAQLWLTNKAGVDFATPITVAVLFEHHRLPFTLADAANSVFVDYDGDGAKDDLDPYPQSKTNGDRDNDGVPDDQDAFPDDPKESLDTDKDGIGNNADPDDDNDGMPDVWELANGLNPLDTSDAALDKDGDGISNLDEYKNGTDPNVASKVTVTGILPLKARLDVLQAFTVTGTNLPANAAAYFVENCAADNTYAPQGTTTEMTFRCTPRLPGVKKASVSGIPVAGSIVIDHPARQGDPQARSIPAINGVSLWNGNFYHSVVDMSVAGKGLSFVLSRSYNAYSWVYEKERGGVDNDKPWRFNWELKTGYVPNSNKQQLYVQREDGAGENFFKDTDGQWYPIDQGNYDQIQTETPQAGQLTLFTREGLKYTFQNPDLGGKLQAVSDHDGNALTLSYGVNGKVSLVTDASGRTYTFTYDADNRLQQVADFTGRNVQYTWEIDTNPVTGAGRERLKTVRDVRDGVTTYDYTSVGTATDPRILLTSIVDPRQNTAVTLTYTDQVYGNWGVKTLQDATNAEWSFDYCAKQPDGTCGGTVTATSFQTRVNTPLTGKPNGGKALLYEFDNSGRLFASTNASGARHQTGFAATATLTAQTYHTANLAQSSKSELGIVKGYGSIYNYTPDNTGNLAKQTNAENEVSQYDWLPASAAPNVYTRTKTVSPTGATTLSTYTASGKLATTTAPGLQPTVLEYEAGLLKKQTDARKNTTQFVYDANGYQKQSLLPKNIVLNKKYDDLGRVLEDTDSMGYTTRYTYDAAGNTATITDSLNNTVQYFYDANGNRIKMIDGRNNPTIYTYNARNELISTTATVDGKAVVTENTYDPLGRLIAVKNANSHTSTTSHNPDGKPLSETDALNHPITFEYDEDGRLVKQTDQDGRITKTDYDKVGRVLSVTQGFGTTAATTNSYTYYADGKMKTVTNPDGKVTAYEYDSAGRLVKVIDPDNKITLATYDDNGNQTSITDTNGNKTTFVYDELNRRTQTIDAKNRVWLREYDNSGNVIKETAPGGLVTTRSFDSVNQLKVLTLPGNIVIKYDYDANGNRSQMTDATGITKYDYDELNRLKKVTDPQGKVITYAYDGVGNLKTLGYPGGQTVTYGYDEVERLTSVTDWLKKTTTYTLNNSGQVTATLLGNGTRADVVYDGSGRQTSLINQRPDKTVISSHQLTLDGRGNITNAAVQLPLQPRLLTLQRALTYDTDNRLKTLNGTAVSHDEAGRITTLTGDTYNYDGRDLITNISGTQTASFAYNGDGHRVSRTLNGQTTRYVVDPHAALPNVLAETDNAGAVLRNYVYGYGLLEQIDAANAPHYYHFDPTGHTLALTDGSGAITDTYAYTPFGETTTKGSTPNPFRYVGKAGVIDDGNGLHYMRARYYRADIARFMSLDAIEGKATEPQGLNRYAYVRGNPLTSIDPSGLKLTDTYLIQDQVKSTKEVFESWDSYDRQIETVYGKNNPFKYAAKFGNGAFNGVWLVSDTVENTILNAAGTIGSGFPTLFAGNPDLTFWENYSKNRESTYKMQECAAFAVDLINLYQSVPEVANYAKSVPTRGKFFLKNYDFAKRGSATATVVKEVFFIYKDSAKVLWDTIYNSELYKSCQYVIGD